MYKKITSSLLGSVLLAVVIIGTVELLVMFLVPLFALSHIYEAIADTLILTAVLGLGLWVMLKKRGVPGTSPPSLNVADHKPAKEKAGIFDRISPSTVGGVLLLIFTIGTVELLVMLVLPTFELSNVLEAMVDALILTVVISPLIYLYINGRKQIEREVRQAAKEWETTFDSMTDLISIQDKDFKIVRVNKAYADTFKTIPDELAGKVCYEVVHGTKEPWPDCPFKQTLETKESTTVELFEPCLGIHLEVTTSPIFDDEGEVTGTVHLAKDITERKQASRHLEENEQKLRAYIESSPDGIFVTDKEGNYLDVNPSACQLLGYSEEELLGMSIVQIVPSENIENVIKEFGRLQEAGTLDIDIEFLRRDGCTIFVNLKAVILPQDRYMAFCRDITERKQMEQTLRESEEKWRSLVENIPSIIVVVDGDRRIGFMSGAATGTDTNDVIGSSMYEYVHPEYHDVVREAIDGVFESGEPGGYETRSVNPDESTGWWATRIGPIKRDGRVVEVILINSDITERKQMERDISERIKELQCLYSVGSIAEMPRITLDELFQAVVNLLPPGWQYPEVTCARIAVNGQEFKTENYRETGWKQSSDITVDGVREGVVEVSYLEEKPELGEGPFLKEERSLIDAVAERLVLTIRRKQMKQELEQKVEQLQDANQKLQELDQMKDNFLSTVSHELRTPLTSIKSFAEILLSYEEEDKETQREFLGIINDESERLTRLINDFLDLAKIEAGRMQWEDSLLEIPWAIQTAVTATHALAAKANLSVDVDLEPDLLPVWGDRDRLVQVVTNLLSNAIKFTLDGGRIRVGAQTLKDSQSKGASDMVTVSVADTGIGIAPEDYDKVFEKFRQVGDTLTDKPRGTGLGLPICKEIVEHYGGRLWVESEPGKGSTFFFTLPLTQRTKATVPEVNEEPAEVAVTRGKIILVVDDEANVRRFLQHELTRRDYRVIEASGGKEAIDLAREYRPDLITLDVLMPDIDGFDVAAVLKNDPDTKDIPILILTVVEDKDKAYRLGADAYMTKPYKVEGLQDEINRLLQKNQKSVLVVDDDKSLVRSLEYQLKQRGFSVYVAYDGKQALEVVEKHPPDLILLDMVMPEMNGYEVMKVLNSNPDMANIPIVVLTGFDIDGGRVKVLSAGATEYFTKEGGFSNLFEAVDDILNGKSGG